MQIAKCNNFKMGADNNVIDMRLRLTIRVSQNDLSFSVGSATENAQIVYEPYNTNKGISIAANLRKAFAVSELLQSGYKRTLILVDTPVMLIPTEEFQENEAKVLYKSSFALKGNEEVVTTVLPDLNAVAVMTISKDLKLVIDDHFKEVRIEPLMQPVWVHLHQRSYQNPRRKLFAYFHEHTMEVVSFQQNRFKYNNAFDATHAQDALYYLLFVWRELGMNVEKDELHLVGKAVEQEWLEGELKKFLHRIYVEIPEKEFRNGEVALHKNIPYDLKALYLSKV